MSSCACPADCGRILSYAASCPIHGWSRHGQVAAIQLNEVTRTTHGEPQTHIEETVQWLREHSTGFGGVVHADAADIIEQQHGEARIMTAKPTTNEPTTHLWPDCAGLEIGDVVTPACGGPKMTIVDLMPLGSGGIDGRVSTARARWIVDGAVPVAEFTAPVACFERVKT